MVQGETVNVTRSIIHTFSTEQVRRQLLVHVRHFVILTLCIHNEAVICTSQYVEAKRKMDLIIEVRPFYDGVLAGGRGGTERL